jgi:hypothetical protein
MEILLKSFEYGKGKSRPSTPRPLANHIDGVGIDTSGKNRKKTVDNNCACPLHIYVDIFKIGHPQRVRKPR